MTEALYFPQANSVAEKYVTNGFVKADISAEWRARRNAYANRLGEQFC